MNYIFGGKHIFKSQITYEIIQSSNDILMRSIYSYVKHPMYSNSMLDIYFNTKIQGVKGNMLELKLTKKLDGKIKGLHF